MNSPQIILNYEPLPKQSSFHDSNAKFRLFVGGMGCISGDTLISTGNENIPAAEFGGGLVKTLFGEKISSCTFLKGQADLYRVTTLKGRQVDVTLQHRFLTPNGWDQLERLSVGSLIASHDSEYDFSVREKSINSQDYYLGGFRPYGELSDPVQVAYQDKLRQFHKIGGDGSALMDTSFHVYKNDYLCPVDIHGYCESEHPDEAESSVSFQQVSYLSYGEWQRSYYRKDQIDKVLPSSHMDTFLANDNACSNIANWDEIINIQFIRYGDFYDLTVPEEEHYLANGIFHHNSGKTFAGAAESIQLCLEYPGNMGLIGRATYPELRDSTWKELLNFPIMVDGQLIPFVNSPLVKRHDKTKMELELHNGSVMIGRPLEDAFDKIAKNLNLGFVWIDELTEIPEEMWIGITRGRLRLVLKCPMCGNLPKDRKTYCDKCKVQTIRHTAFGTTNPEGHDWVWKTFLGNPSKDHFCVQSNSVENTYMTEEYLRGLDEMPDEWKKRYRDGSFDSFSGLVYPEYQDKSPYICSEFDIPEDWYKFVGIDHGHRNPTAILWGMVDRVGRVYIYDEYYETQKRVDEIAAVLKMHKERIQDYIIDPATRQDKGNQSGLTIFSEFEENGIYCTPGKNQVMAGIDTVKTYLKIQLDKKPNVMIFPRCKHLRMEMQIYRWKDLRIGEQRNKPEKPVKKEDHLVDAMRYLLAYAYDTPTIQPKKKDFDYKIEILGRRQAQDEHWMAA